jgi:ATP-dependent helicase/nuclease subunit B
MATSAPTTFLGWGPQPLARAAEALVDRYGQGLGSVLVAVPGARVGRGLAGELRRVATARGHRAWTPPRFLTQGRLVDELLELGLPTADRPTRTFAWERALAGTLHGGASDLFERVPERGDRLGWWRLAERVRALHAELVDEGHDFADLARDGAGALLGPEAGEREQRRWAALATVQERWRALLAAEGLADPHDARNAAIRGGAVTRGNTLALVGIVDGPGLLYRTLRALDPPPDVFVLAPESEAAGFDALGFLVAEHWRSRSLALAPDGSLSRWHVVAGPEQEAELAARLVAHRVAEAHDDGRRPLSAGDVTLGVADEAVIPFLERRFGHEGVRARPAAGEPLERTPPARLLAAFARWLDGRAAGAAAALVRHPDLERVLAARLAADAPLAAWSAPPAGAPPDTPRVVPDIAALFDRVRSEHVVESLGGELPADVRARDRGALHAVLDHLAELLGPLAAPAALPLVDAVAAIRELCLDVYAETEPDTTPTRVTHEALAALGELLDTYAHVPRELAGDVTPSVALELVVRALRGRAAPPSPDEESTPTIEVLGWLELPFDPAPVLVVTGFVEGAVPASPAVDAFLPDSLRRRLGLEDDTHRTARDAYIAATLVATRCVDFLSPRRTRAGDPLFPSRLAFHAEPEEVLRRVQHALVPLSLAPPTADSAGTQRIARYMQPKLTARRAPTLFSVTDFKAYIESPYRYALERLMRLETVDDGARELDPRQFGTLVHEAARVLVERDLSGSQDVELLRDALLGRLADIAERTFGHTPLPAVAMQIEQARLRLVGLAEWQADRARDGWRVQHVEWQPSALTIDGIQRRAVSLGLPAPHAPAWLTGKIDRIDRHVGTGRFAILDYKTTSKPLRPDDVYRAQGRKKDAPREWRDPQLALYCLLAAELLGDDERLPELGYLSLTPLGVDWSPAPDEWADLGVVASAQELACEIALKIRNNVFDDLGNLSKFHSELVGELIGVGFVVAPGSDADETEEGREEVPA